MIPKATPTCQLPGRTQEAGRPRATRAHRGRTQATAAASRPAYLDTLRRINDEVFLLPGVDRGQHEVAVDAVDALDRRDRGRLEGGPVIPDDYDGSPASWQQVRLNVERSGEVGQLVARDFQSSASDRAAAGRPATGQALDYAAVAAAGTAARQVRRRRRRHPHHRLRQGGRRPDRRHGARCCCSSRWPPLIAAAMRVLVHALRAQHGLLVVAVLAGGGGVAAGPAAPARLCARSLFAVLVPFLVFAIGMSHGAQKMNGIMQDIGAACRAWWPRASPSAACSLAGLTALLCDAVGFAVLMMIDIKVIRRPGDHRQPGRGDPDLHQPDPAAGPAQLHRRQRRARPPAACAPKGRAGASAPVDLLWQIHRNPLGAARSVALRCWAAGLHASRQLQVGDLDPGAPELRADSRYNRTTPT
jgi:hypothetical protein